MNNRWVIFCLVFCFCFTASATRLQWINDASGKGTPGYTIKSVPLSPFFASPGDSVGVTDYDKQYNAGGRRHICKTSSGGCHFYWTFRSDGDMMTRRSCYRYLQPTNTWSDVKVIHDECGRMGSLSQLNDGRAVASAHVMVAADTNNYSYVYIDSAVGAGKFRIIRLPFLASADSSDQPIWPNVAVDGDNTIFVTACQFTAHISWWTVSTDLGETWSPWKDSLAGVQLDSSFNWVPLGEEVIVARKNKAAFIVQPLEVPELLYYETADKGLTWKRDTIYNAPLTDSVMAYCWYNGVYDDNGVLHVVYTVIDTTLETFGGGGGNFGSGWRSQIRYWNNKDRKTSIVVSGWWAVNWGGGVNTPTVAQPCIAIDRSNGYLYCTWTQGNPDDASEEGFTNLEIYAAKSLDGGASWIYHQNLTNSPSPLAIAGECESDIRQSLAEAVSGDMLDLFYMNDKNAGNSVDDQNTATMNRMLYYKAKIAEVGVKHGKASPKGALRVTMSPNPFRGRIEIRASCLNSGISSGNQTIRLSIFTTAGRLVRTAAIENVFVWDGKDARGNGLPAGIYLLQLNAGDRKFSSRVIVSK